MRHATRQFWKCFVFINVLSISAVVAQDKLIPKAPIPLDAPASVPAKKAVLKASPVYPPAEYVYLSSKYEFKVTIIDGDVNKFCWETTERLNKVKFANKNNMRINACAVRSYTREGTITRCEIFLPPKSVVGETRWQALYMHELAHCNGWVHD